MMLIGRNFAMRLFCLTLVSVASFVCHRSLLADESQKRKVNSDSDSPLPESLSHYQDNVYPLLKKYCVDCHAPDDPEDVVGFLQDETPDQVGKNPGVWGSVAEQLVNRTMPPADEKQPSEQERLELARWIHAHLEQTACDSGQFAGAPLPRRLNRDQYTNAINDLIGLEFDFVEKIPADGSGGEGFDNNGETLFMPPLLMERYLELASQILDEAIVTPPFDQTYTITSISKDGDATFGNTSVGETESGLLIDLLPRQSAELFLPVYVEGEFSLTIRACSTAASTSKLRLDVDGIKVGTLNVPKSEPNQSEEEGQSAQTSLHLSRGAHQIRLTVAAKRDAITIDSLRLKRVSDSDEERMKRREKATRRLLNPGDKLLERDPAQAAQQILSDFAHVAWRRPVTSEEIKQLRKLFDRGRRRGEPFRQAIKLPLKSILVSPHFLFISETTHVGKAMHRISDLELASRLSFFLWHSLPDRTLLSLAEQNRLRQPSILHEQVKRMIADPRSLRFAEAFAGQWLGTVAVGNTVIPDTNFFKPVYKPELVSDFRRQVAETMHVMLRENRPITEWIDADYVVVNRRLAKHYELQTIPKDERFKKVELKDSPRSGVLGLGAVHMLTSYSRRTSPVLRGGWVLETIFGTRLPSPPPNVPSLPGGERESDKKTVRERLQVHRDNPTCAACHDLIDPIGFALENFDVLGRWREKEGKLDIDANGRLPSGESFNGPAELRQVMLNRKDDFIHTYCERMLGYAVARSLEDRDQCTVKQLTDSLHEAGNGSADLVWEVVKSTPFQFRQSKHDK